MVLSLVKKWLLWTITMYLVFATIGTFTLIAFDASILDDLTEKSSAQDVFLTSLDRLVCTPAIIEIKDSHLSLLRHGLLRTILPSRFLTAGSGLLCSAVGPITKTAVKADKNNILLKLRI
jgi:hypothetical protein